MDISLKVELGMGMQYFIATLLPDDTEMLRLLATRVIPAMTVA